MTPLLVALALPCLYWTAGTETAPALKQAGIERLCVPADKVEAWQSLGVAVVPTSAADLAGREALPVPGLLVQPGLASPTRIPWVTANGWRFIRQPTGTYRYEVPAGKAVLAALEAFAYGADAVLQIDPADLPALGRLFAMFDQVPPASLAAIADFGVVDDGSSEVGELMNLLVRRNLLFEPLPEHGAAPRYPLTVRLGTTAYARVEAADPSALALKIRRQLTDRSRTLRIYGSEVVVGRLTGDGTRARLHLLNYGGREIEGLRVRLHGRYASGEAYVAGLGRVDVIDHVVTADATEFSLPRMASYAVVDLRTK